MLENVQKIEQQEVHKKTWYQRFSGKATATGAAVTGIAITSNANAAGVTELFTTMATELGGISSGTLTVITVLAGVTALLIGWAYFKKVR